MAPSRLFCTSAVLRRYQEAAANLIWVRVGGAQNTASAVDPLLLMVVGLAACFRWHPSLKPQWLTHTSGLEALQRAREV